ncbi:Uncharacterised protein [Mycobacterium tuberculosis]|nr:Uncharacterised protein [Mycobacterium tuberculosis]
MLGLQLHGGIVAPADFQNKPPASTVDFVVEVLLASQRLQGAREAVILLKQSRRLVGAYLRAG